MDAKRLETIIQIESLVEKVDNQTNPFLFYLPHLLRRNEFSRFDAGKALEFTTAALKYDSHPVIRDALRILNNIVAEDGTLKTPGPHHFFGNQHFFWNELGTYTKTFDVISHVFNRTIFFLSITQTT